MSRPVKPRALPFAEEHQYLMTDPVFLIGNGKSRETFDLERLRDKGTIVGCNALHRDFAPDILIAIDAKLIRELKDTGYCDDNICLLPNNRSIGIVGSLKWKTERFNTSGCFGMKMINELMKPTKCYMLGMDGFPGNVYDKTKNYAPNTLQNFSGVVNYYMQVLNSTIGTTVFVNVNEKDAWPEAAHETGQYEYMTFEEFEKTVMAS